MWERLELLYDLRGALAFFTRKTRSYWRYFWPTKTCGCNGGRKAALTNFYYISKFYLTRNIFTFEYILHTISIILSSCKYDYGEFNIYISSPSTSYLPSSWFIYAVNKPMCIQQLKIWHLSIMQPKHFLFNLLLMFFWSWHFEIFFSNKFPKIWCEILIIYNAKSY